MTWVSLICLLALSSAAFGRSAYEGGYGASYGVASIPQAPSAVIATREQSFLPAVPVVSQGYAQQQRPQAAYGTYMEPSSQISQSYSSMSRMAPLEPLVPQTLPLTPADELCRGRQRETVIPIDNGRKFVVCLDDTKGVEQECPKGLWYHEQLRRCERKLGQIEDPCAAQPCLNGGRCVQTEYSYQCQCAPGFDGKTCELDARICQTQYPCGQSPDARCQSFRAGAALQFICIFQEGLAYGLNGQQVVPSPCQSIDGPRALSITNKGFAMCDGERLFIESCPGGTIWDDSNKACVWPDMQENHESFSQKSYGQESYGQKAYSQPSIAQQRTIITKPAYGSQIDMGSLVQQKSVPAHGAQMVNPFLGQAKTMQSYGAQFNLVKPQTEVLKFENILRPTVEQQRPAQSSSYQASFARPTIEQHRSFESIGEVGSVKPTSAY